MFRSQSSISVSSPRTRYRDYHQTGLGLVPNPEPRSEETEQKSKCRLQGPREQTGAHCVPRGESPLLSVAPLRLLRVICPSGCFSPSRPDIIDDHAASGETPRVLNILSLEEPDFEGTVRVRHASLN